MVRSKNFNPDLSQHTLEESWFFKSKQSKFTKRSPNKKKKFSNTNPKIVTIPTKSLLQSVTLESQRNHSITKNNSVFENNENESDDDDIIPSSQDTKISKLRQNIDLNQSEKSKTPNLTPKKRPSIQSNEKLSLNSFSDISSTVVKEEICSMYNSYESIEMVHDLNDVIAESMSENIPDFSSVMVNNKTSVYSTSDQSSNEQLQDTLHNDTSIDKTIYIIPKKALIKLKLLKVKLEHEIPPQHKIEINAGSRSMTKTEIKLFEKFGPLKRGPYVQKEDRIIQKNWENFCFTHNWDVKMPEPFLYMRHENKYYIPNLEDRKNFVRFLANGLPWRSLNSVYFRFKTLYKSYNTGRFTSKEDKILISHMSKLPSDSIQNNCSIIANILKRDRHSVWRRYRRLKDKIKWKNDNEEVSDNSNNKSLSSKKNNLNCENKEIPFDDLSFIQKFIETLMEVTICKNVKELKDHIILQCVWKKVGEKLKMNIKSLKTFWYRQLHLQLFCPGPIYYIDIKIKLIEYLYVKGIRLKNEINWKKVAAFFDGMTSIFLNQVFSNLIRIASKAKYFEFIDQISYLYEEYIPYLIGLPEDKILPRLEFNEGKITYFKEDIEQYCIKIETEN